MAQVVTDVLSSFFYRQPSPAESCVFGLGSIATGLGLFKSAGLSPKISSQVCMIAGSFFLAAGIAKIAYCWTNYSYFQSGAKKQAASTTIPSEPFLPGSSAYQDLVRWIKVGEKKTLVQALNSLPDKESNIQALLQAAGNWNAVIYTNEKYPYYALEAVRQGRLRPADLSMILTFWAVTQLHPDPATREWVPLFNADGSESTYAKELILKTLVGEESQMSEEEMERFFKAMRERSQLQQGFWVVPDMKVGASHALFATVNAFSRIDDSRMMVESLEMFQTFLRIKFGDEAVDLIPSFGTSPWALIREYHLNDKINIAFPFPGIELPSDADGQDAPWYFFTKHDKFHAFMACCATRFFRRLLVKCYDLIKSLPIFSFGAELFIDMNVQPFKIPRHPDYDLNDRFWIVVSDFSTRLQSPEFARELAKHLPLDPTIQAGPIKASRAFPDDSLLKEISEIWHSRLSTEQRV